MYVNYKISNISASKNKIIRLLIFSLILAILGDLLFNFDENQRITITLLIISLFIYNCIRFIQKNYSLIRETIKSTFKFLSISIFFFDFLLLSGSVYLRFIRKFSSYDDGEVGIILFVIFITWFLGGLLYHHFSLQLKDYYWRYIWPFIKNYIFIFAISMYMIFFLKFSVPEKYKLLESLIIYSFSSWVFFTLKFFYTIPAKGDTSRVKFLKADDLTTRIVEDSILFKGEKYILNGKDNLKTNNSIRTKLREIYLKKLPTIFEKLDSRIYLDSISVYNSVVFRSRDLYNLEILPDNQLEFIMNLHPLNDIRRINAYLIEVNKKLKQGGVFVCCFLSNDQRYNLFIKTYPYFIALFFYFLDFLFHRVLPKLPVIQKIYFSITKGNNRALALSEGLGRLAYCGFNFIDVFSNDNLTYCIVYKQREPANDENPSYGILIKLRRIGKDGKEFFVYKLRTMHPYSEYIQSLVYDLFKLEKGGKLKNDFRVTLWGKFLRKLWIDELPMLYNFIKGDLKLFGVRPLSKHYFNLYPDELKNLRIKTKPGLVPPFYYDLPKTFDEIVASEKKYLESYFKSPLKTDIKYFSKAFVNIVFKNARSA